MEREGAGEYSKTMMERACKIPKQCCDFKVNFYVRGGSGPISFHFLRGSLNDNIYAKIQNTNLYLLAGVTDDELTAMFRAGGEGSAVLKHHQISFPKIRFASGATSRVYKGVYTDESGASHHVAVKDFVVAMTRQMQKKFDQEAKILQTLNHPNVLGFYGRIEGTSSLVTEFLEKSLLVDGEDVAINSVRQLIDEKQEDLPWPLRLQIALETAQGISYLHDRGCIHCDLKTANVFLGDDDKKDWIIKIGDFGEARVEHKEYLISQVSFQDPTNSAVGTVPFMAPEVLQGKKPTKQSDVYSFGMLLIELLCPTRTNPWADDCRVPCITSYMLEKKRPTLPANSQNITPLVLEPYTQLIRKCWNEEPQQRPDIKEIIMELKSLNELLEHESKDKMKKDTGHPIQPSHSFEGDNEQDSLQLDMLNLSMHQGSAPETFGNIHMSFEEAGAVIPRELHAAMEEQTMQHDGSNACTFFATTLAHCLEANTSRNKILSNAEELKKFVEKVMTNIPKEINKIRDLSSYCSVDEAVDILREALICDSTIETVMNCFSGVNSPTGEETLLDSIKVLHQKRPAFAVYTCPPISFCIGCCDDINDEIQSSKFVIIDTHCIPAAVGGNGNGTVVQIKYCPGDLPKAASKLAEWIKRRLLSSNGGGKVQSMTLIKKV